MPDYPSTPTLPGPPEPVRMYGAPPGMCQVPPYARRIDPHEVLVSTDPFRAMRGVISCPVPPAGVSHPAPHTGPVQPALVSHIAPHTWPVQPVSEDELRAKHMQFCEFHRERVHFYFEGHDRAASGYHWWFKALYIPTIVITLLIPATDLLPESARRGAVMIFGILVAILVKLNDTLAFQSKRDRHQAAAQVFQKLKHKFANMCTVVNLGVHDMKDEWKAFVRDLENAVADNEVIPDWARNPTAGRKPWKPWKTKASAMEAPQDTKESSKPEGTKESSKGTAPFDKSPKTASPEWRATHGDFIGHVEQWLEKETLTEYGDATLAWCEVQGAETVDDVEKHVELLMEFVTAKPLHAKRFRKCAGRLINGECVTVRSGKMLRFLDSKGDEQVILPGLDGIVADDNHQGNGSVRIEWAGTPYISVVSKFDCADLLECKVAGAPVGKSVRELGVGSTSVWNL